MHFMVDDISIEVQQKRIKHIHLRVTAPTGKVSVSAPAGMPLETVRTFVSAKINWIRKHQARIRNQQWPILLRYITGEKVHFFGTEYTLALRQDEKKTGVQIKDRILILISPDRTSRLQRKAILEDWCRQELKAIIPPIIRRFEGRMNVTVNAWGVKKMKTKWGTCNIRAARIWLNLELAKKSLQCIEHVIVHEMVHLLERRHNLRFFQLMDEFYPEWRNTEKELNELVIS